MKKRHIWQKIAIMPIALSLFITATSCNEEKDAYTVHIDGEKTIIPSIPCAIPEPQKYYTREEIRDIYMEELETNPFIFAQDGAYVSSRYANCIKTWYPSYVPELNINLKYKNIKTSKYNATSEKVISLMSFEISGKIDIEIIGMGPEWLLKNDTVVHLNFFKLDVKNYPYVYKTHEPTIYQFDSYWAVEPEFDDISKYDNWSANLTLDGEIKYAQNPTETFDNEVREYSNTHLPKPGSMEERIIKAAFQYSCHLKGCHHMKNFPILPERS